MTGIDDNVDMYKHIPIDHWPDFIGYLFKYAEKKNSYGGASGNYAREAFDENNGQMTWPRYYAMSDYSDNVQTYGTISVADAEGNVSISDRTVKYLTDLKEYIEKKGASVYFVSSPILYDAVTCDVDNFFELIQKEEEKIGIPYISDPRLYMFPIDLMSNAVNHCNSEGEKIRTSILVDDLMLCGAIDDIEYTDQLNENTGETFVLVDTLTKRFLHKPEDVKDVYMVDANGNRTEFEENVDYVIDYERGTIRRTVDSKIPNYVNHHVAYSGGKFTWINNAGNYNPEGNRSYQIRADYSYRMSIDELNSIDNNHSNLIGENTRNKIINQENITIALCGDSIGAGADTDGEGVFLNYLCDALESYYGGNITVQNLSVGGRSRALLKENMDTILEMHPDILMIEFGTNDHCGADATSDEHIESYKADIDAAVKKLKGDGIDVILIGFPQQNMTWDAENVDATKQYNEILGKIADENVVYFADVYSAYEKLGEIKHISRDVEADFIHHPTEWGHKIYFSCLINVFNFDGEMDPLDFENYVYVAE